VEKGQYTFSLGLVSSNEFIIMIPYACRCLCRSYLLLDMLPAYLGLYFLPSYRWPWCIAWSSMNYKMPHLPVRHVNYHPTRSFLNLISRFVLVLLVLPVYITTSYLIYTYSSYHPLSISATDSLNSRYSGSSDTRTSHLSRPTERTYLTSFIR